MEVDPAITCVRLISLFVPDSVKLLLQLTLQKNDAAQKKVLENNHRLFYNEQWTFPKTSVYQYVGV